MFLTERNNGQTLKTAEWLEKNGKPFWMRYVLVPGYSNTEEDIRTLGEHFKNYKMIQRVEVLPYHTLGVHKYEAINKEYKLQGVKENTPEQLDQAKKIFDEYKGRYYFVIDKLNNLGISFFENNIEELKKEEVNQKVIGLESVIK